MQPREGLQRLTSILRKKPRFGPWVVVTGHTILVIGVTMLVMPTPTNLAVTAILGLIVGVLKLLNRNRQVLAVPLPVVAAVLVAVIVFLAIERDCPSSRSIPLSTLDYIPARRHAHHGYGGARLGRHG